MNRFLAKASGLPGRLPGDRIRAPTAREGMRAALRGPPDPRPKVDADWRIPGSPGLSFLRAGRRAPGPAVDRGCSGRLEEPPPAVGSVGLQQPPTHVRQGAAPTPSG